jgi:DNA polymerase-3 subunit alpha
MAAKAVVRDVGRVLGHPYGFVDTIAKLVPFELGMTLSKALEDEPILLERYQEEEEVKELIDLALKLEGITRNAGKHAGGVVIAPSELSNFTAIYCEAGSNQIVSQFDKDDVEAAGLVKFDFLGLRTLTIIDCAIKNIHPPIDITRIPMDDKATFQLLKACQTTAVFQLESRGMKELIHRLQPDCFEEIIALVALFRPGPLQSGMVDDFIDRKHGRAQVVYPHPDLEPILKATYGVILYQEQVMQIAQVLAGYTLGAADVLRRAMGKKKPEEMAEQRIIFTEGAVARGVGEEVATHIFDLMEKFAGYGFNKSHSAAYALLAYQTAWLKTHYPAAFMAAVLSSDKDNTEKVAIFIHEARQMHLKVLPPSIHHSEALFTVLDERQIVYGLAAIKGVGESAIGALIHARQQEGKFRDLFDFCKRLDLRKVNKRVIEALIKSGAMDDWKIDRAILFASLDKAQQWAESAQKRAQSGQGELFQLFEEEDNQEDYLPCKPWTTFQRLLGEKKTLGLYVSGHPATQYQDEFKKHCTRISALNPNISKKVWICGLLSGIKSITTKRGKKLTIISLEDTDARIEIVLYPELFEQETEILENGQVLVVEGEIAEDQFNGGIKMIAKQICTVSDARTLFSSALLLELHAENHHLMADLKKILSSPQHKGDCAVRLQYSNANARVLLGLDKRFSIRPDDEVLDLLGEALGNERVKLQYE